MTENLILKNDRCLIEFKKMGDRPYISGHDLTDTNNDPTFMTKNVKRLNKAWDDLSLAFNDTMTMSDCITFLDNYKLKCHRYCAMD